MTDIHISHTDIDLMIDAYLKGTIRKEEFETLKAWTLASETHRQYVQKQMEVTFSYAVAEDKTDFQPEKALKRFKLNMALAQEDKEEAMKKRQHIHSLFKWAMRVAAILLIILLPLSAYWYGQKSMKEHFADITLKAPQGDHLLTTLPDGTSVWLNGGSTLIYSQGFGIENRSLRLEGEGYFEVAHNKGLPFQVSTKGLDLTVLGTKFNFRNYKDEHEASISLKEGKVRVKNNFKSMPDIEMSPGEEIVLNKISGHITKSHSTTFHANAWTRDELFFNLARLEDIALTLSRSYGVKITVDSRMKNQRFYGSFNRKKDSLKDIIEIISMTNRLKYKEQKDGYFLY